MTPSLLAVDPVLAGAVGVAAGAIFLSGAWAKWRERELFAQAMEGYELIPSAAVPSASLTLIVAEFLIGGLLLTPYARPWPALAGVVLLFVVTAAVAVNLLRGRTDIRCGCGGASGDQTLSWALVARNAVLALLLVASALGSGARALRWPDYAVLVIGGLLLAGLYAAASQLIANQPRLRALRDGA
ncbi:MAG TPA: MauE/DoxX family redox-associated membrane protein [Gammaproteobacteria bacterium]|nr:MauE/DoxX family redox-associated membrane protein [Gammaproteobacteria bacterium]